MSEKYTQNCQHCREGIPFDTWYFTCLFCNFVFCNNCHDDHPSSHIKWFRHQRTRSVPRGTNPESVECQKCMKMVHSRVQCIECGTAFCAGCDSDDTRGCWENHGHKRLEFVPPPECGVMGGCVPCRTCSSKGSITHCTRCDQGLEDGETITGCLTCEKIYGDAATLCTHCLQQSSKEHDATHEWGSIKHNFEPSADDDWSESKCSECQEKIDLTISSNIRKHSHKTFIRSYGPGVRDEIIKESWKHCRKKPAKNIDVSNEELWSETSQECSLCECGFPNLANAYICLTCMTAYCMDCFEAGPGKTHKHECKLLSIKCEEPPKNFYQYPQQDYRRNCTFCKETIHISLQQNLNCLSCEEWFVCKNCIEEKGSTITHSCSESSYPELSLYDDSAVDSRWLSEQTVLLARQVDLNKTPLTFVEGSEHFVKKDAEDMAVSDDDRIIVTGYPNYDDWYKGRNDWKGQTGVFPKSSAIIDDDAVEIAQEHNWLAGEAQASQTEPESTQEPSEATQTEPETAQEPSEATQTGPERTSESSESSQTASSARKASDASQTGSERTSESSEASQARSASASEPSEETKMHHTEKTMEFIGNAFKLGVALIGAGSGDGSYSG